MFPVTSRVRQWGRSLGVVLPKERITREGIKKDDLVTLLIGKRSDAIRRTFGTLQLKRSTDEILRESDEESWDE